MNVIYRWSMDGLRFCFLGELDTLPSPADLSRIGRVDILFMPVSGTDLTGSQRQQIIEKLAPQIIIPMGSTSAMSRFASGYTSVYRLTRSAALLSRDALPVVAEDASEQPRFVGVISRSASFAAYDRALEHAV